MTNRRKRGYTAADVKELREIGAMATVSIDKPIGEDNEASLGDMLVDESALDPQVSAEREEIRRLVDEMLRSLGEREQRILRMKFGFETGKQLSMEEIGKEFNLSRERVRQLEVKAMRALRHPTRLRTLMAIMDRDREQS
jgi:RNA polymerase primary sigma factor